MYFSKQCSVLEWKLEIWNGYSIQHIFIFIWYRMDSLDNAYFKDVLGVSNLDILQITFQKELIIIMLNFNYSWSLWGVWEGCTSPKK